MVFILNRLQFVCSWYSSNKIDCRKLKIMDETCFLQLFDYKTCASMRLKIIKKKKKLIFVNVYSVKIILSTIFRNNNLHFELNVKYYYMNGPTSQTFNNLVLMAVSFRPEHSSLLLELQDQDLDHQHRGF